VLIEATRDHRGAFFLGRGIEELLGERVPLLRVHVIAPFEARAERIARQVSLMPSRAEERVRRSDEENAWFYRYFFHADWTDRGRYGMTLDTAVLTPHECAQKLAHAAAHWTVSVGGSKPPHTSLRHA